MRGKHLNGLLTSIWPAIAPHLPAPWQETPLAAEPAGPSTHRSARVWKVAFPGGRALAVKLAAPGAPVDGEGRVLSWLRQQGAPVPEVVAIAPQTPAPWLALEWCGEQTLDDLVQAATPSRLARLGRHLALAVGAVEQAFAPISGRSRASTQTWDERVAALRAQAAPWIEAAPRALAWLTAGSPSPATLRALQATLEQALDAGPDVGSLDYNARNVVIQGQRLTLLDFAATGIDWPQRRLVQYGTATGAHGGTFVTVIGPASVRTYAAHVSPLHGMQPPEVQQSVDAHEVLLLLTAASGLQQVAAGTAHPARAAAWANVEARRQRLLALLRRRLVRGGAADAFRTQLT
ncbi:MAG TPA: hypothetical protein VHS99_01850 [Chloroflexota bacterium]|nr:hypothetical protein [Chloroflexota bacterium]